MRVSGGIASSFEVALHAERGALETPTLSSTASAPGRHTDVLCSLDARARIEPSSILVRHLELLGAADLTADDGAAAACDEDPAATGRVEIALSHFLAKLPPPGGKPQLAGHARVRAPIALGSALRLDATARGLGRRRRRRALRRRHAHPRDRRTPRGEEHRLRQVPPARGARRRRHRGQGQGHHPQGAHRHRQRRRQPERRGDRSQGAAPGARGRRLPRRFLRRPDARAGEQPAPTRRVGPARRARGGHLRAPGADEARWGGGRQDRQLRRLRRARGRADAPAGHRRDLGAGEHAPAHHRRGAAVPGHSRGHAAQRARRDDREPGLLRGPGGGRAPRAGRPRGHHPAGDDRHRRGARWCR